MSFYDAELHSGTYLEGQAQGQKEGQHEAYKKAVKMARILASRLECHEMPAGKHGLCKDKYRCPRCSVRSLAYRLAALEKYQEVTTKEGP